MGSTLLIIGAGPGIGAATAARFGREGWRVVLAARKLSKLGSLVESLQSDGIQAEARAVDAADHRSVASLVAGVDAAAGGVSTVLYNAAVLRQGSLFALEGDQVAEDLAVNVGGALATVRAARKAFAGRGGTVLLTGGGLALNPHPDYVGLGIGKAGIRHLAQALFGELRKDAIHIGTVTVSRMIGPGSPEAAGVADAMWALQSQAPADWQWEARFPGG